MSDVVSLALRRAALVGRESVILARRDRPGTPNFDGVGRHWRARDVLPASVFDELAPELKAKAFAIARTWNISLLEAIKRSLGQAILDDLTLAEWIPTAQRILDGFGGAPGARLVSGEAWSPWYADLVFRNAWQAAYQAGRYAEMFNRNGIDLAPYILYSAIRDARTRPSHMKLDGLVGRKDDPVIRVILPPSDHNCRCTALELTEDDLRDGGYRVTRGSALGEDVMPPEGWRADRVEALVPAALRRQRRAA